MKGYFAFVCSFVRSFVLNGVVVVVAVDYYYYCRLDAAVRAISILARFRFYWDRFSIPFYSHLCSKRGS